MKLRFTAITLCAMLLAEIAHASDIVIFDAEKNIGTPSTKVRKEGNAVIAGGSGIEFKGNWDLSKNLDFKIDVENPSATDWLTLKLQLFDDQAKMTDLLQKGCFLLAPKERKTVVYKHPRPPKYPEVAAKIKSMRASPFEGGDRSVLPKDYSKITKIKLIRHWGSGSWSFKLYNITATEHDPADKPSWFNMSEKEFFPFVDKYGQFKFREWPGKVHSDAELKEAAKKEQKELAEKPGPAERDRFGGWTRGGKHEATGHFRTEKIDGKWWLIDPDGNLFWSHGVVRVTPSSAITPLDNRKFYFEDLPQKDDPFALFYTTQDELLVPHYKKRGIKETYDFSAANIFRKYGKQWREKYADMAHKRLRSWGLNTIANSSDSAIFMQRKTPYVDRFEVKGPALSGSDGWWWPFRDPFAKEFHEDIVKNLKERKEQLNDPWCIGFFVDNELHWGGPEDLAKCTLASPANMQAKIEFSKDLKKKYAGDIKKLNDAWKTSYSSWDDFLAKTEVPKGADKQDLRDFTKRITEEYFKVIHDEIKKLAPNKLYMGCRFSGYNPLAIEAAAKYCDIISYNLYRDNLKGFKLPKGIDKPVMVGEWHFGSTDRGPFHPSLIMKPNQNARAQAYYDYAKSALENPCIVGIHWHQFSDQAVTGRFDGENFQVGMTDVCDNPYPETIAKIREIGYDMYNVRENAGKGEKKPGKKPDKKEAKK